MGIFGENHTTAGLEIMRYAKMRDYYIENPHRIQPNEKHLGRISVRLVELSESENYPRRLSKLMDELMEFFGRNSKYI